MYEKDKEIWYRNIIMSLSIVVPILNEEKYRNIFKKNNSEIKKITDEYEIILY